VEPANRSLWIETTPETAYPPLEGELEVDVVVVGAGITGVTTAWLLKREGLRVALVDMRRVGEGTTGYTTAKLTVGHNLIYADLANKHGEETARAYATSNQWAIGRLEELVLGEGIDCDWEPASNYVYTEDETRLSDLKDELEAARRAGISAELTADTDLPFPVLGAIRIDSQAQFHPRKFLQGLAEKIIGDGSHVFERTLVEDVRSDDGQCAVLTEQGRLQAGYVVLATHLPFLDRGLFFAKAHPQKSYAIAAQIEQAQAPRGMYISAEQPTRSIRSTPGSSGSRFLILGGEGHKPGRDDDTRRRYESLERFLRERFDSGDVEHRWSTHDYVPLDRLPYIGRLRRSDERLLIAAGFAKWGLTKAVVAAAITSDAIMGRDNPWASVYNANRFSFKSSARKFAIENAKVAAWFIGDRVRRRGGADEVQALQPGDGKVVWMGGRHLAVHRDENGQLHALSARCTHLGCLVGWNRADRTWECPCHGSQFAADGTLHQGPATEPLDPLTLPS
jgi:glycine/D-amino acid oxidase-like deaminating enzyme/nitrite reductase/ring-hydroxylating ferredoxin subunit